MTIPQSITIDGTEYLPRSTSPTGIRAVIVVDRGWIFAGDVTRTDGRIRLDRAVWVFRWQGCGFDGVLSNPRQSGVTIKPLAHVVDIPEDAEVFCVPVSDTWGL